MKSGDSRGASGVFYPLQDHRAIEKGHSGRSCLVATRIVGEDPDWGQPVEDPKLRGDMSGFFVWQPKPGGTEGSGGAGSGGSGGGDHVISIDDPGFIPPDARPPSGDYDVFIPPGTRDPFDPPGTVTYHAPLSSGSTFELKAAAAASPSEYTGGSGAPIDSDSPDPFSNFEFGYSLDGSIFAAGAKMPSFGSLYSFNSGDFPTFGDGYMGGFGKHRAGRIVIMPGATSKPRDVATWRECFPVIRVDFATPSGSAGQNDNPTIPQDAGVGGSTTEPSTGGQTSILAWVSLGWVKANSALLSKYGVSVPVDAGSVGTGAYFVVLNLPIALAKVIPDQYYATPPDWNTFDVGAVGGAGTSSSISSYGGGSYGVQVSRPAHRGPECVVLPTRGNAYDPDFSMRPVNTGTKITQPYWPTFPGGMFGVSVITMDTDKQIQHFMPTDPRLVAVNRDPAVSCGTIISDLNTGRFDLTRTARLQNAFRVVKNPTGKLSFNYGTSDKAVLNNTLALNIGVTGMGDGPGLLIADGQRAGAGTTRLARLSRRDGGFHDCGSLVDKHQIGKDADGNPINPSHIQTGAFFTDGGQHDGPLAFETPYIEGKDYPYPTRVHMQWNAKAGYVWPIDSQAMPSQVGMWEWRSSCVISQTPGPVTPPGTPREPKDPPPPPIPRGPTTPGGGSLLAGSAAVPSGGGQALVRGGTGILRGAITVSFDTDKGLGVVRKGNSFDFRPRHHAVTVAEMASPGFLARPQRYESGEPDLRNAEGWGDAAAVKRAETKTPVVGRLSAWGAQGGKKGGTYLPNPGTATQVGGTPWVYTQSPGTSRELGGTAPGGWLVTPPEVDISDIDDTFAPTGLTVSPTYFATAPGAYFGSGTPELASGGLMNGWSWGSSGVDLSFRTHTSAAVVAEFLAFRKATNDINFNDGLAFTFGTSSGSRMATAANQKFAFHGASPIAQDTGWTAGAHTVRRTLATGDTLAQTQDYLITIVEKILLAKGLAGA